jgi:hypothetical protein
MQLIAIGDEAIQYAWRDSNDSSEHPNPPIACVKSDSVVGAKSGAIQSDPNLALVVESWEKLPEAVRAGIVAMVKASAPRRTEC